MWQPLLEPGLTLLSGSRRDLRGFCQELAHHALHEHGGVVLWCDGDHGFNPYDFAELNLERGHQADHGADRLLVKRCMTAFQWATVLTRHLDQKLLEVDAELVIAAPFERLLTHEELCDWEQEDHTRFALRRLKDLARRSRIPILVAADMQRWWRTHPILAKATYEAAHHRWMVDSPHGGWRLQDDEGTLIDPWLRRQVTLLDYLEEAPATQLSPLVGAPARPASAFTRPNTRVKHAAV